MQMTFIEYFMLFFFQYSLAVLYFKIRSQNLQKFRLIPDLWNSVLHLFLEFHFAKCDDECKNLMIVGVNCCALVTTLKMDTNSMTNDLRKPTLQKNSDFAKIITRKRHRFRVTRIVVSVSLILRLDQNKTVF